MTLASEGVLPRRRGDGKGKELGIKRGHVLGNVCVET